MVRNTPPHDQANEDQSSNDNQHFPPIPSELQENLNRIVSNIINNLGYVGAMVATLEPDDSLPVRAYAVDTSPEILEFLNWLETKFNIGFISPKSVAYLDRKKYRDNLSVRAIKGTNGHPEIIVSDNLHDLFQPVLPKWVSNRAQKLTKVKQVVAVPFFIASESDGASEVVGNLFAASRQEFSKRDIDFLTAFGQQVATTIQSQRRLAETQALERIILALQESMTDETQVFQIIVNAVVNKLGYLGAMVAPLEGENALPVRAYAVDLSPQILKFLNMLETKFKIGFISPKSVAYLDDEKYDNNLSVRAIKSANVQTSEELYDLLRPVVNKTLSKQGQKIAGIGQVIAVPFFIEEQPVGNLFVATQRKQFSNREIELLRAFGQQAAVGIRNARVYHKSEERRKAAQIFAKMAFSSSAYLHALRGHIGTFRMYAQMAIPQLTETLQEMGNDILERLDQAADILDNLHQPWREEPDSQVDINKCLNRAIDKIIPDLEAFQATEGIAVHVSLDNLPLINTSPDMLTEAFRVLIKNALEAVRERSQQDGNGGDLWVESRTGFNSIIEVLIRDNGIGIKAEDMSKIFEIRWSTKEAGMGFGLFWTNDYIEGLNGSIQVESVWGEGTSFYISIPSSSKEANT